MFLILSKTISFLLMPTTWIVLALLLSLLFRKWRRPFFLAGFGLLLLFTNPFISNALAKWWEVAPVPVSTLPPYELGIVLGGITTEREPRDRVHVTNAADRILQAIHLYRKGKIKKILLTGGSGAIITERTPEAELMRELLRQSRIPERDIVLESDSRNTYENAHNSAAILQQKFPGKKYLLITSAYHMRRAKACFDKQQIPVDVFSVDLIGRQNTYTPDALLLPKAEALQDFEIIIKEMAGTVIYGIAGYI